jgi:hypothetical protein
MVLCRSEDAKSENGGLGYAQRSADKLSLTTELIRHLEQETASFHTARNKGRANQSAFASGTEESLRFDLMELPGLDDLSNPIGVLANLESMQVVFPYFSSVVLGVSSHAKSLQRR